jgi:hypothetical protein
MISFCSKCYGWQLTLIYQPKFGASCSSPVGRVVPILEYAIMAAVAAAVIWAIVN